jgi:hypothetical protein
MQAAPPVGAQRQRQPTELDAEQHHGQRRTGQFAGAHAHAEHGRGAEQRAVQHRPEGGCRDRQRRRLRQHQADRGDAGNQQHLQRAGLLLTGDRPGAFARWRTRSGSAAAR